MRRNSSAAAKQQAAKISCWPLDSGTVKTKNSAPAENSESSTITGRLPNRRASAKRSRREPPRRGGSPGLAGLAGGPAFAAGAPWVPAPAADTAARGAACAVA